MLLLIYYFQFLFCFPIVGKLVNTSLSLHLLPRKRLTFNSIDFYHLKTTERRSVTNYECEHLRKYWITSLSLLINLLIKTKITRLLRSLSTTWTTTSTMRKVLFAKAIILPLGSVFNLPFHIKVRDNLKL